MSTLEVNGKRYTMPELLAYWISERELIRRTKEEGHSRPWSDDPVFRRVYFTNVHREDDRVTRWIRANYTPELFGEFYEAAIVAARIFNRITTLEEFKLKWFPVNSYSLPIELREWGLNNKTWGNAYVITTHGQKMSKVDYCVGVLAEAEDKLPFPVNATDAPRCEDYYGWIMKIDGLGSFLAAQIVADLKNTEGHILQGASDWWTFSAPGPGSLRGLKWYHSQKITNRDFQWAISEVNNYITSNEKLQDLGVTYRMCMQDLQNCLCEFDKYCRVLTGAGRSKRNYRGV